MVPPLTVSLPNYLWFLILAMRTNLVRIRVSAASAADRVERSEIPLNLLIPLTPLAALRMERASSKYSEFALCGLPLGTPAHASSSSM